MSLIAAESVSKDYAAGKTTVRALTDVTFKLERASFACLVGPSGSGKTTLLNLIGCLDKPSGGRLTVSGQDISRLDRVEGARFRGRTLGFIFQDFNLIPVLTAYENIEYPLVMIRNVPASDRRRKVLGLLEAVGMAEERDKYPDQLSGGQKQRVAIARALVTDPELVLADEPTANLDGRTASIIIGLMKKMCDELGTTFLFSTHDARIVDAAEIVYTLGDGKIIGCEEKSVRRNHGKAD